MVKLKVRLRQNPYDIIITGDEQKFAASLKKACPFKTLFVITDKNVAKLYLKKFETLLRKNGFCHKTAVIPSGEAGKSIKSLESLYDKALKEGIDRKSCVIALGGGVVGDVAGFFAATYMRGIKFVQVPTTLLAMTDSSVGGKTAVNTKGGKNIAGAFYQPSLVWINSSFLSTLSKRQIKSGMAEVVKYALAFDKKFCEYLLKIFKSAEIKPRDYDYMIFKSCAYKARVVERDEKETKGLRESLNFGHTLAHALETYTGYKKFLHGEAVAAGMLFAAKLSASEGACEKGVLEKVEKIIRAAGFAFSLKKMNAGKLAELMKKDKKSLGGNIRFVLLKSIGKTANGIEVGDKKTERVLREFLTASNK